ncbi:hypothetical protein [Chryseobacterium sp. JK1]
METINIIYFIHNLYSNGHTTFTFKWYERIDEDESIGFDFHLKTEK